MNLYQTLSIVLFAECLFAVALDVRRRIIRRRFERMIESSNNIILFDREQLQERLRKVA